MIPEMPTGSPSVPTWAKSHKEISIDVNSLTEIKQNMHDELHSNFAPNYKSLEPDLQKSSFGQHPGFEEANFIASVHDGMLEDARKFVSDYQIGLQSLSAAAGYMAQHYGDSDSFGALDISEADAQHAFDPKKGDHSVTGGHGDGAAEGTTPGTTPPPAPPPGPGGGPRPI